MEVPPHADSPEALGRRRFRDARGEAVDDHERGAPIGQVGFEQLLKSGFRWLRFPAGLEQEYRYDTTVERRRHLRISLHAAAGLYVMLALLDFMLLHDIFVLTLLGRIAVSLLAAVALQLLPDDVHTPPNLRDAAFAVLACVAGISIVLPLCLSHSPNANYAHSGIMLVPLFACIAARLPFRYALAVCAFHLLFYSVASFISSTLPPTALVAFIALLLGASAFSLVANYELEYNERRNYLEGRLAEQRRREQSEAIHHLESLSNRDGLTGIGNRRQFDLTIAAEWKQSAARLSPLSLLIADVDFFKLFNDTYGHPQGDVCLRAMAGVMQHVAQRHGGTAARLGGEEFALLLPALDIEASGRVANEVCTEVRALALPHSRSAVAPWVTVSVGAATVWPTPDKDGCAALLSAADQALYKAKVSGRDRAMHEGPWTPVEVSKRSLSLKTT